MIRVLALRHSDKEQTPGMRRHPTLSERVLRAVAVAALIAWYLLVLVVALGYTGPAIGLTWVVRAALLVTGTLITTGLVRLGVRSWRQAIARPLPPGRSSLWLARQPGWRLAVGCWSLFVAPELGTGLWLSPRGQAAVAATPSIADLISSVVGACLVALLCRVLWQRQAENSRRQQPGHRLSLSSSVLDRDPGT